MPEASIAGRAANGLRFLLLGGFLIAVAAVLAHFQGWPWLQSTLGPTAYVLVAHPNSNDARARNAVIGHAVGIAVGLFCLAIFGLWTHPSIVETHKTTLLQLGASALAVGLTMFFLAVFDAHHAPAGATTLLITTGIAKPETPLFGLILGLATVILLGSVVTRLPFRREAVAQE